MNTNTNVRVGFRSHRELRHAIKRGEERERAGNRMAKQVEDLGKWAAHIGTLARAVLSERRMR